MELPVVVTDVNWTLRSPCVAWKLPVIGEAVVWFRSPMIREKPEVQLVLV
jgi:hypothetical protein